MWLRGIGGEADRSERARRCGGQWVVEEAWALRDTGRDEPVVEHPGSRGAGKRDARCGLHRLREQGHRCQRGPHSRVLASQEREAIY